MYSEGTILLVELKDFQAINFKTSLSNILLNVYEDKTENSNGRVEKRIQKVSLSRILVYRTPFVSVITENLQEQQVGHHQNNGLENSIFRKFFVFQGLRLGICDATT